MTTYMLRRNGKYLSERYDWGLTPNVFAECYFPQVLEMSMNFKDSPLEVGEVADGDFDKAIWKAV